MSLNIVIPMAGLGSRFAQAGYSKPKPFIDVKGKPMIWHVLNNLKIFNAKYILIARAEHIESNVAEIEEIKKDFDCEIITIDQLTEGTACTVLFARKLINNETPLLIANSDQYVDFDFSQFLKDANDRKLDGSILTFEDDHVKWSYAKLNSSGFVTEVKEKVVISTHATVGIYYFNKGSNFVDAAIDMIAKNDRVGNEFYTCPTYNYLIKDEGKVGIYSIDKKDMWGLGTPEDLKRYLDEHV